MCVLFVEDDAVIRETMLESLQDAGFDVVAAEHGRHAMSLLDDSHHAFTIVVTDFHMPGDIDGSQVAAHTRALHPGMPVVIATGRPEVLQASWRNDLGYALLPKPYRPSTLLRLLHSLLPAPGNA